MRRFFVPDKEKCEAFLRAQKNVLEQNHTKGEARLWFCGSRAPEGGEAHTILLYAVCPFYSIFYFILSFPNILCYHVDYYNMVQFDKIHFYNIYSMRLP